MLIAVGLMVRLLRRFNLVEQIAACALFAIASLVDTHYLFILGLFVFLFLLVKTFDGLRGVEKEKNVIIGLFGFVLAALAIYFGSSSQADTIYTFGLEDFYH